MAALSKCVILPACKNDLSRIPVDLFDIECGVPTIWGIPLTNPLPEEGLRLLREGWVGGTYRNIGRHRGRSLLRRTETQARHAEENH
jgi:hypothetical protein